MASSATTVATQRSSSVNVNDWMECLSWQLQYSSTGQRASLRRIPLTKSFKADGTIIAFITKANVPLYKREHDFDRWRMLTHFAAMLVGTGEAGPNLPFVHKEKKCLGTILGTLDYPEVRLLRLLSVRGEALDDQVRRVARILAQKGERQVNLWRLYHLLSGDAKSAEAARIAIAHNFYIAKP
ncbi:MULTISPECIES: hypothetical protein [unclassified Sphingomonas]|uniref:hypothetical protein n=1 Tax=unclassified Sphingomonas TaxID=196159 RepID=UPI0012E21107|nr:MULTISPECIES: hypothetical protein [unclassified Sphingomonas]